MSSTTSQKITLQSVYDLLSVLLARITSIETLLETPLEDSDYESAEDPLDAEDLQEEEKEKYSLPPPKRQKTNPLSKTQEFWRD